MFRKGDIYTVHENPEREEPSERIELVREGYSFWAFLLTFIWLFANSLYLAGFFYLLFMGVLVQAGTYFGLGGVTIGLIQLAAQLLLGLHAHDLQRLKLRHKGYHITGVVAAESELLATQRAYQHHPAVVH